MSRKVIYQAIYSFSIVGLSFLNMSCDAQPAAATRVEVQADQLKEFPLPVAGEPGITLASNQFFLWPEGVTAEQATRVFDISAQIDKTDQHRKKLEGRQKVLQNDPAIATAKQDIILKKRDLNTKKSAISTANANLKDRRKKLVKAQSDLDGEKAKPTPDAEKIKTFQALIDSLTGQIDDLANIQLPKLQADQDAIQLQLDALNQNLDGLQKSNQVELDGLAQDIVTDDQEGQNLINEVTGIVTWYDLSFCSATFKVKSDGSLSALIKSWIFDKNLEPGGRDFSSDPGPSGVPTIQNLKYDPKGGVFDFDVQVVENDKDLGQVSETFSFHVSRNKYQAGDGKVCYLGDLIRKRNLPNGTVEIRKGIAKLVDSN